MKVLLILVDGMRPDGLEHIKQVQKMKKEGSYALDAQTVYPSVTLPCHMSLFHSVDPDRHGTTDNTYTPQVRPVKGLCEVLAAAGKKNMFFYNWSELRDLTRPGSLAYSYSVSYGMGNPEERNRLVTENAVEMLKNYEPDFAFVYLGWVDEAGHDFGWMKPEYMRAVEQSWNDIERLMNVVSEEYMVIVTADHGGHGRHHGNDIPEDMTIPVFFKGETFQAGKVLEQVSIKDIAPTILSLFGLTAPSEWEGRSLV